MQELIGFLGPAVFWGGVGLIVGWNLLAQPAWVKAIYDRVVAKFS